MAALGPKRKRPRKTISSYRKAAVRLVLCSPCGILETPQLTVKGFIGSGENPGMIKSGCGPLALSELFLSLTPPFLGMYTRPRLDETLFKAFQGFLTVPREKAASLASIVSTILSINTVG